MYIYIIYRLEDRNTAKCSFHSFIHKSIHTPPREHRIIKGYQRLSGFLYVFCFCECGVPISLFLSIALDGVERPPQLNAGCK